MPTWTATIAIKPLGKGRPRARAVYRETSRATVKARYLIYDGETLKPCPHIVPSAELYTPAKTRTYEQALAWEFRGRWGARDPLNEPVALDLLVLMPRPKRLIWKTKAMPRVPHISAPDISNIQKSVEDALQAARVIANDSLIYWAEAQKWYAAGEEGPGLVVTLTWGDGGAEEPDTAPAPF